MFRSVNTKTLNNKTRLQKQKKKRMDAGSFCETILLPKKKSSGRPHIAMSSKRIGTQYGRNASSNRSVEVWGQTGRAWRHVHRLARSGPGVVVVRLP